MRIIPNLAWSGSANWTKSNANGSGFGFPDSDSRIYKPTTDSHRIRNVPYGSPPPDLIELQIVFMCEGYNFKASGGHEILYHILNFCGKRYFTWVCLPQTPPFYGPLNMYGIDDLSIQPGPCIWGRHQNAFWMPVVNKCHRKRSVRFVRFIGKSYEIRDWKNDI